MTTNKAAKWRGDGFMTAIINKVESQGLTRFFINDTGTCSSVRGIMGLWGFGTQYLQYTANLTR